jgi:octaprenyl-diphosphate synthase
MLRPTLLLLSSEAGGTSEARAASFAAVVELIHLATLVHDDAVDHSVLRRGMPTINALFTHQVAVIAGDFLYSRAVQELVRLGDLEALRVFAKASNELTVGEMRQLSALDALAFSEADYEFLIKAKTAALFSASCEVGALCGAASFRDDLSRYGAYLGMAFQVTDDLLDYTGASETVGKPTGLDLREHKVTLPLIKALRTMSIANRREVDGLFSAPEPSDQQIGRVIEIVTAEGGLEYARRRGEEYAAIAEESLAGLPETPARGALYDTLSYVMDRRS